VCSQTGPTHCDRVGSSTVTRALLYTLGAEEAQGALLLLGQLDATHTCGEGSSDRARSLRLSAVDLAVTSRGAKGAE